MKARMLGLPFVAATAILMGVAMSHAAPADDSLADRFRDPPQPARPQVWWHWMSGNVTEEGARLDLEWMQRVGIGGVHAFSGGMLEPTYVDKPAPFMSDVWRSAYRSSVARARAAGMDVTIAGSPGWSQTGGPWVKPVDGMKKYVWTTTYVTGGKRLHMTLPQPAAVTGAFGAAPMARPAFGPQIEPPQAAGAGPIVAFRLPDDERVLRPRLSSAGAALTELESAPDDLGRVVKVAATGAGPIRIDADMGGPVTVRALTVAITPLPAMEILASDDGKTYRTIRRVERDDAELPSIAQTLALPQTRARFFRLQFGPPPAGRKLIGLPAGFPSGIAPKQYELRLVRFFSGARVDRFEAKAGFQSTAQFDGARGPVSPRTAAVRPTDVIDLTSRVGADGVLDWAPPPGRWAILRYGWSLTGHVNGPAEPAATGLEVDKLDRDAVKRYIDTLFAKYRDDAGIPLGPKGIDGLLTDSWEAGVQNWTPRILEQFRRLRGYDPTPWLPVLAGNVVGSSDQSEAFLFDVRQTLKDLVVENHYQVLADAAHAQGMTYYTEVQGDTPRAISDGMTAKARADIPTAEFWYRPFATDEGQPSLVADMMEAASAAHVYGKKLAAAEAMTVAAGEDPWAFSPAMLKPVADQIFASGINRILVHESHLQPFADRKPGLAMAFFGQFFNRNDTWAEQAKPWTDYLARTSYLLQQGRFVADIAYFYGEDRNLTQLFEHRQNTDVPAGYGYDYINPEALLTKLSVQRGRLVTESGMSYRILYVPPTVTRYTLPALRKLDSLIRAGAVVVAHKPVGGLGMASPDGAVRAYADRLWGTNGSGARAIGAGRLYSGTLTAALAAERLTPDIQTNGQAVLGLHRVSGTNDLYYVVSRSDRAMSSDITFRVTGRKAEWWSPEDGSIRPLSYEQRNGTTRVSIPFDPHGAGFVVFGTPTDAATYTVPRRETLAMVPVVGPWDVRFEADRGAPPAARFDTLMDWSKSADPGIRFFSGAATYSKAIDVSASMLASGNRVMLDLGEVSDLAVVSINGVQVATAWHAPYRVDLTGRLKTGANQLEVTVVNLWVNRLIGDKQPGAKPVTYAPQSPYRATSPLRRSGLIGPVELVVDR